MYTDFTSPHTIVHRLCTEFQSTTPTYASSAQSVTMPSENPTSPAGGSSDAGSLVDGRTPTHDQIKGPYPHVPEEFGLDLAARHDTQPHGDKETTEWAIKVVREGKTQLFGTMGSADALDGRVSHHAQTHTRISRTNIAV